MVQDGKEPLKKTNEEVNITETQGFTRVSETPVLEGKLSDGNIVVYVNSFYGEDTYFVEN